MTNLSLMLKLLEPGSLGFLIVALVVGLVLFRQRDTARLWAWSGLVIVTLLYVLLALPIGYDVLAAGLDRGYAPITTSSGREDATAIVLLGGGSRTIRGSENRILLLSEASATRALEAARVYKLLDARWVIASGGTSDPLEEAAAESEALRDELVRQGVPADRILLESSSLDTREQALAIETLVKARGIRRLILVTSRVHMPRALGAFRAVGLDVIPAVAADQKPVVPGGLVLVPNVRQLEEGKSALHEYISLLYYRLRGWLKDVPKDEG